MKYCLIVNPYSRGGRARKLAERCVRYLALQGCSYDAEIVTNFQQAYTLSQKANQKEYDVIVAVGGDGTLNRVLNGFYDGSGKRVSGAKFGVLHTGTSPDFCKSYHIPLDLKEAVQSLVTLNTRTIPVGRIHFAEQFDPDFEGRVIDEVPNSKVAYFACCANIGLGAALARKANSGIRKYLGDSAGTLFSLLQILKGYRPGSYETVCDEERQCQENVFNITVGLTHHIASGIKSYKENMDERNRFYVMTVRNITLRTLLPMLYKVYRGREYENTDYLSMSEAGTIHVLGPSKNPEIEYDGDPGGYLPCSIDVASDRLELIC
jgi:diacylglycerol kinase family enzyme